MGESRTLRCPDCKYELAELPMPNGLVRCPECGGQFSLRTLQTRPWRFQFHYAALSLAPTILIPILFAAGRSSIEDDLLYAIEWGLLIVCVTAGSIAIVRGGRWISVQFGGLLLRATLLAIALMALNFGLLAVIALLLWPRRF